MYYNIIYYTIYIITVLFLFEDLLICLTVVL